MHFQGFKAATRDALLRDLYVALSRKEFDEAASLLRLIFPLHRAAGHAELIIESLSFMFADSSSGGDHVHAIGKKLLEQFFAFDVIHVKLHESCECIFALLMHFLS